MISGRSIPCNFASLGRAAAACFATLVLATPVVAVDARRIARHDAPVLTAVLPAVATIPDVPASPVSASRALLPLPAPDSRPLVFGSGDGRLCLLYLEDLALRARLSADGGTTWSEAPSPLGSTSSPVFGYRALQTTSGRIYVAAIAGRDGGGREIRVVRSDDLAAHWSDPSAVPGMTGKDPDYPYLAIDATDDGRVAIAWTQFALGFGVFASVSADGGATWTEAATIKSSDGTGETMFPDVAIDPASGRYHVAYSNWQWTPRSLYRLRISQSDDGGATWSAPREIRGPGDDFVDTYTVDLAMAADGSVLLAATTYAFYDSNSSIRLFRSTDGGYSFEKTEDSDQGGPYYAVAMATFPKLAVEAGSSTVLLIHYRAAYPGAGPVVRRSTDHGATWEAPTAFPGPQVGQDDVWPRPKPLHLPTGSWLLTWDEYANPNAASVPSIRVSRSDDDGATWSDPAPVTPSSAMHAGAFAPSVAPISPERVFVAYEDVRDGAEGTPDVRGASLRVADLTPEPDCPIAASARSVPTPLPLTTRLVLASDGERGVYALHIRNDEMYVAASRDRGLSFSDPVRLIARPRRALYPAIAATLEGSVYVVASEFDGVGLNWPLLLFRSNDFGATWTQSTLLDWTYGPVQPVALANPRGQVVILFTYYSSLNVARSDDHGATFAWASKPTDMRMVRKFAACAGGDTIALAWQGSRQSDGRISVWAATTRDWGVSYSPIVDLRPGLPYAPDAGSPSAACASSGRALASWVDYYPDDVLRAAAFDGSAWASRAVVPWTGDNGPWRPRVAFGDDQGSSALIVYEESEPKIGVHVVRSIDGGGSYGAPLRLDGSLPRPDAVSYHPSIVGDGANGVWAFWFDASIGAQPSVLVARSTDAGATFGPPRRLDHERPPGTYVNDWGYADLPAAATLPRAGVLAWLGQSGTSSVEVLVGADDLGDQDRDGVPAEIDCDDADPTVDETPCANQPPVAVAGPPQTLECTGDLHATAVLDGSASHDPDSTPGSEDDIASYAWSEGGVALGSGPLLGTAFALGAHDVVLTVTDRAGASDDDATSVTVVDTTPPAGEIVFPLAGACFGPAAVPVRVVDTLGDTCDPAPARRYTPGPGPSYAQHGDWTVRLDVQDVSGNEASASTAFTIDLVPPAVALVEPPPSVVRPPAVPFAVVFGASDDDGASGGVAHEWIDLNGCVVYDGATYGDADGLLSDESVVIDERELCRIFSKCGFGRLETPTLSVHASDCGGNTGAATRSWPGALAPRPGTCGPSRVTRRDGGEGGSLVGPGARRSSSTDLEDRH